LGIWVDKGGISSNIKGLRGLSMDKIKYYFYYNSF